MTFYFLKIYIFGPGKSIERTVDTAHKKSVFGGIRIL